ncbi:MAG: 50S ribosomal protein L19e [Thermoplasmata archaeon]
MNLTNQRRMAADILKCGAHRVWIDPNRMDEVADAITRDDVRAVISAGLVRKLPVAGQSRGRTRYMARQRRKGRRRGPGRRKGARGARDPKKRRWIRTIRAQRDVLRGYRDDGRLAPGDYRRLYLRAKGGMYRSRSHLEQQLQAEGVLREKGK